MVQSSVDGQTWTEIDRHDSFDDMSSSIMTFAVSISRECRFIRLVQLSLDNHGNRYVCISAFEFFGALIEPRI
jgi:hypothetical protein